MSNRDYSLVKLETWKRLMDAIRTTQYPVPALVREAFVVADKEATPKSSEDIARELTEHVVKHLRAFEGFDSQLVRYAREYIRAQGESR